VAAKKRADLPVIRLPAQRYTYAIDLLEIGRMLLQQGQLVLNPFDVQLTSLEYADSAWLSDLGLYMQTLRFYEDAGKPRT
jgi:hypothetical protein